MIRELIWDGRKAKIALDTLMSLKDNGGLGLSNLEFRDKALKASWVYKIQLNDKLKNLAYALMENPVGDLLGDCNLRKKDIKKVFPKITIFWENVLNAWSCISNVKVANSNQVENQVIWLNSEIKIDNKPLFNKKWFEKGIIQIKDLLDNCKFISLQKFQDKYEIRDVMHYLGLVSAIPKEWKKIDKREKRGRICKYF